MCYVKLEALINGQGEAEGDTLLMESNEEWLTVKDAAKRLKIPYQSLLRIVDRAVDRGEITVRESLRDRRAKLVELNQLRRVLEM